MNPIETYEGEFIEEKVARVVENKEPIEDGAPIIYTERKDGVIPAYNIRTDKWDIAQVTNKLLLTLAIATSLDAMAAGYSLHLFYVNVYLSIFIIGIITFIISYVGVYVGKSGGEKNDRIVTGKQIGRAHV